MKLPIMCIKSINNITVFHDDYRDIYGRADNVKISRLRRAAKKAGYSSYYCSDGIMWLHDVTVSLPDKTVNSFLYLLNDEESKNV